jgi:16S rRNA (uracil1498-N3)-methyltransferase
MIKSMATNVNRFFIPASSFEREQVRLGPEQSHQVCHVLRLVVGDPIVVLDNSGVEYEVTLTAVSRSEVMGRITGQRPAPGEPAVELVLFQSLLAREKFEWVLQKGTEVGVARFVPVLTERSLLRAKLVEDRKLDRWRRIVTEAAEQSHRGRIPKISQIVAFREAVDQLVGFDRRLIAAPFLETVSLREALHGAGGKDVSVALMIGPEGGFTQEEVALAGEKGAVPIRLGPRVLRTETAALVACALILHELGEMGP